jgi:glycosyltransferase involved in cell wall biosynthesis
MIPRAKPRLLVLTSTFPRWRDDPEPPFVFELSRRLTDAFDITVLAPRAPGSLDHEIMDRLKVIRFPYFIRRWENLASHGGGILNRLRANPLNYLLIPLFLLGELWALIGLLRRQPIDIIHAHWLIPQGLVAVLARWLTRRPVPLVCTSHGGDLYALQGAAMRRIKQGIMHASDRVSVVSTAMSTECRAMGIPAEKIAIISMGVDMKERFTPNPLYWRNEHQLLFVGRLVDKKGLPSLFRAMPQVLLRQPRACLTIAGGGPQEPELRRLVRELGIHTQVEFLGMVSQTQLPKLYRSATLFVAPFIITPSGDQEGLGLVLVEASGCCCPLIGGDVPAVRDVIQDGQTGILVDASNPAALAEAIIGLLGDPDLRHRLATNARQYCCQIFDWASVAERYARLLWEVVTGNSDR